MTRRGDIVLVSLDPVIRNEQGKHRPAVVVSNDGANLRADRHSAGVISVVPITSNVTRVHSFQVLLTRDQSGLDRDSKAQGEQIRSVSMLRVVRTVGRLGESGWRSWTKRYGCICSCERRVQDAGIEKTFITSSP